jgi:BTB/POZ domain
MDHQVCLRWNNFHSSLAATLEYMWDEETLVDVTLFCEGQEIRAHKVVLSACSPAFKTLLKNNNCQHPIIILHNISLCDLEAILQFIYKGEVNIEQGQLNSLLRAAASLQIRGLSGIAEREKTVETAPTEEPPPKKVKKNNPKNSAASEHHEAPKKRTTRNSKENNEMHFITPKEEPLSEEESPVPEIPESDVEFALMEQLDAVSPLIKQPALPSEDSPTAESQSNPNQGI